MFDQSEKRASTKTNGSKTLISKIHKKNLPTFQIDFLQNWNGAERETEKESMQMGLAFNGEKQCQN